MRVTRKEIVRRIEENLGCSRQEADQRLDAVLGTISQALAAGEEVRIYRFGKFFPRPKRTSSKTAFQAGRPAAAVGQAMAVAFKGFAHLNRQLNVPLEEDLERALSQPVLIEKRSERRNAPSADATAVVRISGIPVCEFQLSTISDSGTSFLVPDNAQILRNIRVGQEIDIHIHQGNAYAASSLQRCRIVHITPAEAKGWEGMVTLGVKVLGKLPV